MHITSKEYGLLKGAERVIKMKNITPEDARKAAGYLYAYAGKVEKRHNNNIKEQQLTLFEDATWVVVKGANGYSVLKIDFCTPFELSDVIRNYNVVFIAGDEDSAVECAQRLEDADF